MDGSGALVGGDVVGGDAEDAAVEERVLEGGAFELRCRGSGRRCRLRAGSLVLALIRLQCGDDGGERALRRRCRRCRRRSARATYSRSGLKATARDAGRVQGVVVQMMV